MVCAFYTLWSIAQMARSFHSLRSCIRAMSVQLLQSGGGTIAILLDSQYLLWPRECSGSEAVGALSSEAWNSASCQVHELKLASWMIDMWPRHSLTQSPANLTASHSYTNEPSKDLKACPTKPRLNCSTAEWSTGKAGCCFKPLSFGLAC